MAKPIKETPILTGNDAETFIDKMKAARDTSVSTKERAKIRKNFATLQAIAKF